MHLEQLLAYSKELYYEDPQLAVVLGKDIYKRAKKIQYEDGMQRALTTFGIGMVFLGDPVSGIRALSEVLKLAEKTGHTARIINTHKFLGNVYRRIGNYKLATKHYHQGIHCVKDTLKVLTDFPQNSEHSELCHALAGTLLGLANMLTDELAQPAHALPYLQDALQLAQSARNEDLEAVILNGVAGAYLAMDNLMLALPVLERSQKILQRSSSHRSALMLISNAIMIGKAFRELGEHKQAETYLLNADKQCRNNLLFRVQVRNQLGKTYLKMRRFADAAVLLEENCETCKNGQLKAYQSVGLDALISAYEGLGKKDKANAWRQQKEKLTQELLSEATETSLKNLLINLELRRLNEYENSEEMVFSAGHLRKAATKKYAAVSHPRETGQKVKAIRVELFGKFMLTVKGKTVTCPRKKARQVFKYLLIHYGHSVTQDTLIDTFWQETDFLTAKKALKNTVLQIRNTLDPERTVNGYVATRDSAYHLDFGDDADIDMLNFKALVAQLQQLNGDEKYGTLKQVAALYKGTFLAEDVLEEWTSYERESLKDLYLSVLAQLAQHEQSVQNTPAATRWARKNFAD
ncbi:MAG: hypothetical protein CMR00_06730 [[Chlorobium] sp. 445]|nr:MAG: hypothetical protein CMR00_06730 [[Chlorobium] sp. 445]